MSAPPKRRPPKPALVPPAAAGVATAAPARPAGMPKGSSVRPFLLDYLPLETERDTRLSRFFARLREGRVSTTRCSRDQLLLWPPRTACPRCHTEELAWVDLPEDGRLYAFSATLVGAPLGMEDQVPFAVGLVDLEGVPLRLFGRIEGRPWNELRIGGRVRLEPYDAGDDRWFYRFRAIE